MSRRDILAVVMRAIDDLAEPEYNPEDRYHEVVGLLSSIDWGVMPVDVIRSVFRAVIRKAPLDVLARAPQGRNLADEARAVLECNAEVRAELAEDDARTTQEPRRCLDLRAALN